MSNVIKAYTVRFNENFKMTVDTHLKYDKVIEEKQKAITVKTEDTKFIADENDGFTEGLSAVVVDSILTDDEQKVISDQVIEDARQEAHSIIEMAKKEAEAIKNDAYAKAQKKGYDDGMQKSLREAQRLKDEYEMKSHQLQLEYDQMVAEIEPNMVDIISSIIKRMTGILVDDKKDVIVYLVEKALKNMDRSNEYIIKVSEEDYEYVSEHRNILLEAIGHEVPLLITADSKLSKCQCFIETDSKVLDCSIDVQLDRLISDLKLLGRI